MTPSEEMKAAAKKLRKMASETAGGIWKAEHLEQHDCWWVVHTTEDSDSITYGTVAETTSVDMAANAVWIALMGPEMADTLATWLEISARDAVEIGPDPTASRFARLVLKERIEQK